MPYDVGQDPNSTAVYRKVVVWSHAIGDFTGIASVAEINEAATKEFPGVPLDQLKVFACDASVCTTLMEIWMQRAPK